METIINQAEKTLSRRSLILLLGALTAFGPMSIDMYLPAFVQITQEFEAPAALVKMTLGIYILGISLGQLIYGPLSDQWGRKNLLIFGIALFSVSAVGCALAPNVETLIFFRLLQALGGCTGMVLTRAIVRDMFEASESARIFSTLILIMGAAPILAPTLGGLILAEFSWRYIFWLLMLMGLLAVVVMYRWLPESHPPAKRNPEALARSFSTYFFLLRDRTFMMYSLSAGMVQASMFCYITSSSFVFMKVFGLSELQFGRLFGMIACGFILASQVNNYFLKRFHYHQIFKMGLIVDVVISLFFILVGLNAEWGVGPYLIPLALCISCVGFIFPNATAGALSLHPHMAGSSSALMGMLTFGCSSLAILGMSLVDFTHPEQAMALSFSACVVIGLIFFLAFGRDFSGDQKLATRSH